MDLHFHLREEKEKRNQRSLKPASTTLFRGDLEYAILKMAEWKDSRSPPIIIIPNRN